MEPINPVVRHILLWRADDIFTGCDLDAVWGLDFNRGGDLLCLLDAPQQVKPIILL